MMDLERASDGLRDLALAAAPGAGGHLAGDPPGAGPLAYWAALEPDPVVVKR